MDLDRLLWRGADHDVVASVLLLVAYLTLRGMLVALVRKAAFRSERLRIRWLGAAKRTANLALVLGLVVVWGTELRTFALSAAALGAAFLVAIREVVLCVSGFVINAAGDGFATGDRIVLGVITGDVVEHGLFTTTLLEVDVDGRRTGRTYFAPNSLLLTQTVVNETSEGEYVTRVLPLGSVPRHDFRRAEAAALAAAERASTAYVEEARTALVESAKRSGLPPAPTTIEVIATPAGDAVALAVRMPVPVRRRATVEQAMMRLYLDSLTAAEVP